MEKKVANILRETGFTASMAEARRLIHSGKLQINGQQIFTLDDTVDCSTEFVTLKCGSHTIHTKLLGEDHHVKPEPN